MQFELLPGDVIEATEVEVVAAGREARAHRVEVDTVGGRVDQQIHPRQRVGEPGLRVSGARQRLGATVGRGDSGDLLAVKVQREHAEHLIRHSQIGENRRRDRSGGAEHRDSQLVQREPP